MTPEAWAAATENYLGLSLGHADRVRLTQVFKEAINKEREACERIIRARIAQITSEKDYDLGLDLMRIADAIAARGRS